MHNNHGLEVQCLNKEERAKLYVYLTSFSLTLNALGFASNRHTRTNTNDNFLRFNRASN